MLIHLRAAYFNNCIISYNLFKILAIDSLTNLYIYKCSLELDCLTMLFTNLTCTEIFIHTLCDIDTDSLAALISKQEDCSTLLIAKDMILGYKPTTKQIAVVLQLNTPISVLKLMNYKGTFDTFNQITRMIFYTSINWTELDFGDCEIGEIEYDVLCRYFKTTTKRLCSVNTLKLPSEKLTMFTLSKLPIKLILMVKELVLCGNRHNIDISKFKHLRSTTTFFI